MKILIIGGVAGGATAAARLRRIDEKSEIVMVERGEYVSFANCGLPYHIGGIISDRSRLLVSDTQSFKDKFNVEVRVKTEAIKINRDKKTVTMKNLSSGEEYEEAYDKLLLSPGASPLKLPIPGTDNENVFNLRNMKDMDTIISWLNNHDVKKAVVVGGGFIGLEMVENLKHKGLEVSLVELADQVMINMDYDMAAMIHTELTDNDVSLYLSNSVEMIDKKARNTVVRLKDGMTLDTDIVIMSAGVRPETTLAEDAGIELGNRGIKVNEYMQTNDENIYAVGDAVEIENQLLGIKMGVPLAGPANRQGRIVADNIVKGNVKKYEGAIGTSVAKIFDLTAASTGLNEKTLKRNNMEYLKSFVIRSDHAGYYPGAVPITLKLLFSPEGKIYGAQAAGLNGVDKRMDVLATAIKAGLTVEGLEELELSYAPPYGSAKDPVNISGYVSNNIVKGEMKVVQWEDIPNLNDGYILLDVREKEEVELGTINKSNVINIPLGELRERLSELDKTKTIIIFCQVGQRGYYAYNILRQNGFEVRNLTGGYKVYNCATKPIEQPKKTKTAGETMKPNCFFNTDKISTLDATGLQCPGPIMETYKKMNIMERGEILEIKATDPGFKKDIVKWAEKTGNRVLDVKQEKGIITAKLQKGTDELHMVEKSAAADNKTIVVFSGDLDKALASFVIANGAAAMGKKVTMFFTFWGLNVLRSAGNMPVQKTFMEKMFGKMMPKGAGKLKLSKMNMMGMGTKMIKGVMKDKNIDSLEKMMKTAVENGVKLVACQMSMDMMGIKEEELIPGVEIGGVATYLADAEDSNVNLFI